MRARRSHRVMAALALTSVALGACSVLTGLDADYSSSAHDGAAAIGSEGGGDGGPGTDGQVGMEGSTTDGMVTPDGGDGSVLSFCKAAQGDTPDEDFFCTDFENDVIGATGPVGWSAFVNNVGDGGTIALVPGAGVGASHALDIVSDTPDTSIYRQLRIEKQFAHVSAPDQFKSFEVQLHFRLVSSVVDYDALALLVFGGATTKENGIAGYKAGVSHQISHEGPLNGATVMINDGLWHSAAMLLEHTDAGTPFFRTLSFDDGGTPIETRTPNHTFDPTGSPVFAVGTFNTLNSAGLSHVQFDNIIVRRRHF